MNVFSGGHSNTVSWDHFFISMNQYYTNLRHETGPASDMSHIYNRHHPRGITPQEIEGLACVLQLVRQVAEQVGGHFFQILSCYNSSLTLSLPN